MEIKERTTRRLLPSAGCLLTQSVETPLAQRVFAEFIILAPTADAGQWRDIPAEEARQLIALQKAENERLAAEAERERRRAELRRQLEELESEQAADTATEG